MTKEDRLYKETLIRVGPSEMKGIDRLLDKRHFGIAEKHTVSKLVGYIKTLEKKAGLDVPDPENAPIKEGMIKVNTNGGTYYEPATA